MYLCFGCAVVTGGGCTVVVVVTAGGCAVVVLLLRPRRWWLRCHHPTSHCSPPSSSSSSSSSSSPYLHPTSHCSPISSSSTNSLSPPQLALFADHLHSTPRTLRRPITDLGVHLGIFHRKSRKFLSVVLTDSGGVLLHMYTTSVSGVLGESAAMLSAFDRFSS